MCLSHSLLIESQRGMTTPAAGSVGAHPIGVDQERHLDDRRTPLFDNTRRMAAPARKPGARGREMMEADCVWTAAAPLAGS